MTESLHIIARYSAKKAEEVIKANKIPQTWASIDQIRQTYYNSPKGGILRLVQTDVWFRLEHEVITYEKGIGKSVSSSFFDRNDDNGDDLACTLELSNGKIAEINITETTLACHCSTSPNILSIKCGEDEFLEIAVWGTDSTDKKKIDEQIADLKKYQTIFGIKDEDLLSTSYHNILIEKNKK